MFLLLLMLYTTDGSNQIGIVENSSARCDDSTNNFTEFESKLLRGEENLCNIIVQVNVVCLSQNNLWMDTNDRNVLVFEVINNSAFGVKTLNNGTTLAQLKSEAVFNDQEVLECFWKTNNKKLSSEHVFEKMLNWGFDHHQVFSTTQQMSISVVYDDTRLNNYQGYNTSTNENSCRGDSGGRLLKVSGWGVVDTTKTRKCHWPAFWLVVCPWYGVQHCQSNIISTARL